MDAALSPLPTNQEQTNPFQLYQMFLNQLVVASQRRPQKLWSRRKTNFVVDYERFDLVKSGSPLARSMNIIQQTKPTNEHSGTKGIICNNAFTKDPHNAILFK